MVDQEIKASERSNITPYQCKSSPSHLVLHRPHKVKPNHGYHMGCHTNFTVPEIPTAP